MSSRRFGAGGAVAAAGVLVLAACGGGSDGSSSSGFSVAEAISQIPASVLEGEGTTGSGEVYVADLAEASRAAGLERPSDPTDGDLAIEWYIGLTRGLGGEAPPEIFVPQVGLIGNDFVFDYDSYVAELGFGLTEIDTITEFNSFPKRFTTVTGDVSFPDDLPEVAPGVRTIGEGDDMDVGLSGDRSLLRPLMRPLRVAERDGVLAASLTTDEVEAWLDGGGSSLADTEPFGSIAEALDDVGVVTAYLSSSDGEQQPGPVGSVGLGWTTEGGEPLGVIVWHHDSEEAAAAELDAVTARFEADSLITGDPLTNIVTLDSIEALGSNVVARLRFPDESYPGVIFDQFLRLDVPFVAP